ncbi:hypothetical protein ACIGO6_40960 [Streptomyces sp. NPDC053750]|uniref:hypothetical protein n=1 Tax=Streptomyces sp. NPDC053750 TaxID=3365714 RepID=UPI0037D77600
MQISLLDRLVQLCQRVHLRHRREVVAAEVTDLPLGPALLVGAVDAGAAVKTLDADLLWVQKI